jgi:hypothetical protein
VTVADDFKLNEAAIELVLTDEDEMVGRFLRELAEQAATVARARVPARRPGSTWSSRSTASPPGFTAASIHTEIGHFGSTGNLWASANAAADPSVFLEDPRVDRVKEPFLTTGLWSLEGTF